MTRTAVPASHTKMLNQRGMDYKNAPQTPILILTATTTGEKLHDYQVATRHFPIIFEDIRKLTPHFHSSEEEEGESVANAKEKLHEISGIIDRCRIEGTEERALLLQVCRRYGAPEDRVFFATEDTELLLGDKKRWGLFRKKLEPYVPEDILERADQGGKGVGTGPETGPIFTGTFGPENFMELVRQSAKENGYSGKTLLKFIRRCNLVMTQFSNPTAPPITISGSDEPFLYHPTTPHPDDTLLSADYFLQSTRASDKPQSLMDKREKVLLDPNVYMRAALVQNLANHFGFKPLAHPWQPPHSVEEEKRIGENRAFRVGLLPAGPEWGDIPEGLQKTISESGFNSIYSPISDKSPSDLLSHLENTIRSSDSIILMPCEKEEDRILSAYTLFSLIVAKQLDANDMYKPLVVMNLNGCYDKATMLHASLVNQGMSKDFTPVNGIYNSSKNENKKKERHAPASVKHTRTSYYDVLSGNDYNEMEKVALQLLNQHRNSYKRRSYEAEEPKSGGDNKSQQDLFKVAVFLSASNDNKLLLESAESIGFALAERDYATYYGAGDRHAMGALLRGNLRCKQENPDKLCWIGAFSTEPILRQETQYGIFPEGLNYWEQTKNIYERMAKMIEPSNAIVIAPGGDGTMQEWLAVLLLKKMMPDQMKNKALVIYNMPTLEGKPRFWNQALKFVLGKDYELLTRDKAYMSASELEQRSTVEQKLGIYVEESSEEVIGRLEKLKDKQSRAVRQRSHRQANIGIR